jgi:hypothetical protein
MAAPLQEALFNRMSARDAAAAASEAFSRAINGR